LLAGSDLVLFLLERRSRVFSARFQRHFDRVKELHLALSPLIHSMSLRLVPGFAAIAFLLAGCQDSSQSPPHLPEAPQDSAPGGSTLLPIDLVYVCGNKFMVTNANQMPIEVTYRVVGTDETGSLTLSPGSGGDPAYSETELVTTARGAVQLYHEDQLITERQNEGLPCATPPNPDSVPVGPGAQTGSWTPPFNWPVVAVHLTLLPDGRVLSWGLSGQPQLWDPVTGIFVEAPEPVELFCAGHSLLPDGRLLVTGGHISDDYGLRDVTIFTPGTSAWTRSTPMRYGRWYPTNTTMASGEVVILAGREDGEDVPIPEVWEPSGAVRVLTTASLELPYYPRTFLAPNGLLFYAGEERTTRYLDPRGTGTWREVARRRYGRRDYAPAVMYDEGKILYVGGGRTTNTAEIIDLNQPNPTWEWTGSMAFARRHHNGTVLPTGEVLVTGGTSGTDFNDQTRPVRAAELWNPTTGAWTTLASNAVTRTYHGTSILLPDARVLHAGSGSRNTPNELNAELFSPPYLFKGPQPTISSAPPELRYGAPFTIETPQADAIASVSLIRLGSTTHAFDMNQRFQRLAFSHQSGGLTVSPPTDPNRTPPGHYMLFVVSGAGVPSVAKIVRVS